MNTLQDVRYGLRGLRRNPGFSATAILSLALGIGATLAIFTITDHLLLRPLPYRDSGRLALVWEWSLARGRDHNSVAPANYLDWKRQNDVFEEIAGFVPTHSVLADGIHTEELQKQLVTAELLPMLGVKPVRGRLFTAEDDRPGAPNVQIISYRLWQSWFGGDEHVVGRKVQVNSTPATIVGVLPPEFYFMNRENDLWEPLGLDPARDYHTQGRWMQCLGRLKPGVTRGQAQAHMAALAKRLEAAYPKFDAKWSVNVEPLREGLVREVKTSLWVLMGAVGLLLAVACVNVANLLLARHGARRREIATRLSLGAARSRVVRQLLTESTLLGLAGGVLGVLAARWEIRALMALAPADLTRGTAVHIDLRILLFAVGISVLTGILFGLAPAVVTSRSGLSEQLREGGRTATGGGGRLRPALVGAEVALSVMLLVGATLLFRTLVGLQAVDPGLNAANVLTFRVQIPASRYPEPAKRTQFFARAIEQIERLPGVRSASAVSYLPFDGLGAGTYVSIGGQPPAKPGEELVANIDTVMPGYFRTMGIPLVSGRDFSPADNDPATPYRFIVNQAFVRKYLHGQPPLEARISANMDRQNPFGDIIGVVGDVKDGALDKEPRPTVYYIHTHLIYTGMVFVVRTGGNPMAVAEPARRIIRGLDSAQPIADVRPMRQIVADTFSRQRFSAVLFSGFSLTALLLAAVGIYGVLAYSVTERTREIGVRTALGARPAQIVRLIVGKGMRMVLAGAAVGIAGALAGSRWLASLLFGVGPRDAATLIAAPVILLAVALGAAWLPARRASRLDPMEALRTE